MSNHLSVSAKRETQTDFILDEEPRLRRQIGLNDAVYFILGNVIGVGIFLFPKTVLETIPNAKIFLILWIVGGIVSIFGALSAAELGVLLPRAGGDYVYLHKAFGMYFSFLYGYLSFFLSYTGSIATLSVAVVQYQINSIIKHFGGQELGQTGIHITAISIILFLSFLNYRGIKNTVLFQRIVTIAPIGMLIIGGIFSFFYGEKMFKGIADSFAQSVPIDQIPFEKILIALLPIYFTYTGWNSTLLLGEDIRKPEKTIPRSMLYGLSLVTLIYVGICLLILATVPFKDLTAKGVSINLASKSIGFFLGDSADLITSLLIACLIFGGINTTIIGGSRLYLAMGRDQIFFSQAKKLHKKYGTPYFSIWAQALLACLLILVFKDLDNLIQYTTLVILFLSMMTIASIFPLRKKIVKEGKDEQRIRKLLSFPYYPLFPLVYIAVVLLIIVGVFVDQDGMMKFGVTVGIIASSLVVYLFFQRKKKRLKT